MFSDQLIEQKQSFLSLYQCRLSGWTVWTNWYYMWEINQYVSMEYYLSKKVIDALTNFIEQREILISLYWS